MSLITRAGDLVYTFRFLKLLVTKFEDTDAYKLGIIDADGKRIKSKGVVTSEEKAAYTPFHKLVFNIKKLLAKAPGGSSRLATYAAALFLLKEKHNLTDDQLNKILDKSDIDIIEMLDEQHSWYMLENEQLSPGIYRCRNEKVLSETWDELVLPKDRIRVDDYSFPVGNVLGISVYTGTHITTGQKVHFTAGEIYR